MRMRPVTHTQCTPICACSLSQQTHKDPGASLYVHPHPCWHRCCDNNRPCPCLTWNALSCIPPHLNMNDANTHRHGCTGTIRTLQAELHTHTHLCAFPRTTCPCHSPSPPCLPHPNTNDANPREVAWHGLACRPECHIQHPHQPLGTNMHACPMFTDAMLHVHTTACASIPQHDVPSLHKGGLMSPIPAHALTHCTRPCECTDDRHPRPSVRTHAVYPVLSHIKMPLCFPHIPREAVRLPEIWT